MSESTNSTSSADDPTFSAPPTDAPEAAPPAQQKEAADPKPHDPSSWLQQEGGGQRSGAVLSRTCSSVSQRFKPAARQSGIRRTFSMRKSSSVRKGYWRIQDTADADGSEEEKEEEQQHTQSSKKKKKGRFRRACKKLFGF